MTSAIAGHDDFVQVGEPANQLNSFNVYSFNILSSNQIKIFGPVVIISAVCYFIHYDNRCLGIEVPFYTSKLSWEEKKKNWYNSNDYDLKPFLLK